MVSMMMVVLRSGSVIYSAILHMTMNLSTSIVSVTLYQKLLPYMDVLEDIEDLPQDILLYLYALTLWMLFLAALAVTGIVLYFVFRKKFTPYKKPDEPSTGKVIGNCVRSPMFWCFVMVCLGDFVSYYLPDIVKYLCNGSVVRRTVLLTDLICESVVKHIDHDRNKLGIKLSTCIVIQLLDDLITLKSLLVLSVQGHNIK